MEWTVERQKFDDFLRQEIVVHKRLDAVFEQFASTAEAVEFSNARYPYPYRRNSLLALLVQAEDLSLIKAFWAHYFAAGDEQTKMAERFFLQGENQIGQRMNYHYFREAMPPEILRREAAFLKTAYREQPWTPAQQKKFVLYQFLCGRHEALARDNGLRAMVPSWPVVYERDKNDVRQEVMLESFAVWQQKAPCFGELLLVNNAGNFSEQVHLDLDSKEPAVRQVFKQLDFADRFFWAGEVLPVWVKRLKNLDEDERRTALYFGKNHGLMVINQTHSGGENNLRDSTQSAAYMNLKYRDFILMGVNRRNFLPQDEAFMQVVLPHELAHGVDLREEEGKPAFSDMDFMKLVDLWMFVKGHKIQYFVGQSYQNSDRRSEVLARIVEQRQLSEPVLQRVKAVFNRYAQMALEGDREGISRLGRMAREGLGKKYAKWQTVYAKMEKCAAIQFDEGIGEGLNISSKWRKAYTDFYLAYRGLFVRDEILERLIVRMADQELSGGVPEQKNSAQKINLWCKKIIDGLYRR